MHLDLRSPLIFVKTGEIPENLTENEDFLLCFELDSAQSRNIEPNRERLLGSLVFSGRKTGDSDDIQAEAVSLPAGNYLFTQRRDVNPAVLNSDGWLDMAIEQQKDGLWERYRLENRLYVRFLFEDGGFVTQLFRSLSAPKV